MSVGKIITKQENIMMRKTWLRVLASVFAVLLCLNGCAGVEEATQSGTTDAPPATTTTAITTTAPEPEPEPDNGWVSAIFRIGGK